MRRAQRLFALAELLRARRTGVTALALAERLGVSVRTVYRDLDALRDAELPLHGERGRGGGFVLDRSYSMPPVNFTAREAAVLLAAGGWLIEQRMIPYAQTLQTALDKVRAALPAPAQRELDALQRSVSYVGVPAPPVDPQVQRVIERAWLDRRALRLTYDGAEGTTTRRVRIRSVVVDRRETLLNTDDLDKQAARQFKLHRVRAAKLLPT
ncbi:MAG: HTH domain-containing protein [Nannocystaceae bacterium]|nr:HTH domain-containing protein [Nannocystaceae bacterium]